MLLDIDKLDCTAEVFIKELASSGIPCYGIQWPEAYEERAYKELNGFGEAKFPFKSKEYTDPASVEYDKVLCPTAKKLKKETLSLFLHPSWEEKHISKCIDAVLNLIDKHRK